MEKENINNNIEDDLNRRNRNWDKISALISDVDDLSSNVDGVISDVDDLSSNVDDLINYVGDLETLTTDEKSNIVGALNEIDASHKTHKAESASKHITESGSNSNGRYIKFDDGTMICYSNRVCSAPPNSPHGTLYSTESEEWTFPSTFISTPSIFINEVSGVGSCWGALGVRATTTTGTSFRLVRASSGTNIPTAGLYAIGRWK